MIRRIGGLAITLLVAATSGVQAQATLMPSYNAPYRAFERHEFGATLSFPSGPFTGAEGQYRFGYQNLDVGFRLGALFNGTTEVLVGVEGRGRVLTHSEQFPLDGAVVFGVGTIGFDALVVPGGLSLGRRIDIEDSPISITPYAQPTAFLTANGGTDFSFALGLGADIKLSSMFDVRASFSVGDLEGFAISAVWVK